MLANRYAPGPKKFLTHVTDTDSIIIQQLRVGSQLPTTSAVGLRESEGYESPASPGRSSFCSLQVSSLCPVHVVWSCILTYLTEKGGACLQRYMLRKWDCPHVCMERVATQRICPAVGRCVVLCLGIGGALVWGWVREAYVVRKTLSIMSAPLGQFAPWCESVCFSECKNAVGSL